MLNGLALTARDREQTNWRYQLRQINSNNSNQLIDYFWLKKLFTEKEQKIETSQSPPLPPKKAMYVSYKLV